MQLGFSLPMAALTVGLSLSGCSTLDQAPLSADDAYVGTRIHHAVLVEDSDMLKNELKMAPRRTLIERGAAGVMLPFAALTDALFWPFAQALRFSEASLP